MSDSSDGARTPPRELLEAVCRELLAAENILRKSANWTTDRVARADINNHKALCARARQELEQYVSPMWRFNQTGRIPPGKPTPGAQCT